MIRVTVWNEFLHEKQPGKAAEYYPDGIHGFIGKFLGENKDYRIRLAALEDKDHGLGGDVLDNTDVLIWWGHMAHDKVRDDIAEKVKEKVLCGMGLIVLHSGHFSKPFRALMGTTCSLKWRDNDFERLWTVLPGHPIAKGVPESIELDCEEMYGEMFDIPQPDELVFIGWFRGGEVFRSGCCWNRGYGKVFFFQPGHEHNPTYHNKNIQRIISNAVQWVAPVKRVEAIDCPHVEVSPEEKIKKENNKG